MWWNMGILKRRVYNDTCTRMGKNDGNNENNADSDDDSVNISNQYE